MGKMQQYRSIEDYICSQSEDQQKALRELKECIKTAAPDSEETFTYNVPSFALIKGGKMEQQIMIAAFKNHVGFYPHPTTIEHFANELKDYKTGKGTVQFPLNKPIPCDLVKRMVEFRLELVINSM
jgi:uncharacterized protein YdhG (YjbR/CyaY superfamily)